MIDFKINGKPYKIPQSFDEMQFKDYCRCFQGLTDTDGKEGYDLFRTVKENEAAVLSRVMGENDAFAMDLPLDVFATLTDAVHFVYDIDSVGDKSSIDIDGKTYVVPKPNEFSLRQWIDADVTMQDKDNPSQYIELLGILLVEVGEDGKTKPYTGEWQKMTARLERLSCSEALPLVMHFFRRGAILSKLTHFSSKIKEVETQLRQAIRNSLSNTTGSI